MILSYAKPFNEKMREQLVKIWKKRKKHVSVFQHFQSMTPKQRKIANRFCWYKNTQQ